MSGGVGKSIDRQDGRSPSLAERVLAPIREFRRPHFGKLRGRESFFARWDYVVGAQPS